MLKVTIQGIDLFNFKGFANASLEFDKKTNKLYGKSGCGKSTIRDAWLWVCGLDVKNVNPAVNNKIVPNLDTTVRCKIFAGENEYLLSRTSKQKWKTLESGDKVFNGFDASNFEFDGVPMTATTYRDKICETFKIEKYEYLKFLCDANYFNADKDTTWNYKKRREILFKIGDVDQKTQELNKSDDFELIREDLLKGLTTTEITKALNSSDRKLSETKRDNTMRITERTADLSVDYDFDALREELTSLEKQYKSKQQELENLNNPIELNNLKKKQVELRTEISQYELSDMQERNKIISTRNNLESICEKYRIRLKDIKQKGEDLKQQKEKVQKTEYQVAICPVCKQEIHNGLSKEEAEKSFEANKRNAIKQITAELNECKKSFEETKTLLENALVEFNNINEVKFIENEKIQELKQQIAEIDTQIQAKSQEVDDKAIRFDLITLENTIKEINSKLAFEQVKSSAEARIKQLEHDNLEIAKQERTNSLKRQCNENYLLATVKVVNESINSKFDTITWNLFDTYNADAEKSYREECEVMFDKKLYSQCSTGQQLIANFYTVIGLQKAFDVSLPIFFDEAQSSTFDRKCEQQLIELETIKKETNINGIKL